MKYMILGLLLFTTACAQYGTVTGGDPVPVAPTTPPAIVVADDPVADLIGDYNANRFALGQNPVAAGLVCTLYAVPGGTGQIAGAQLTTVGSWTYKGTFNMANGNSSPGATMMPAALRAVYVANYIIKCTGLMVVTEPGYYSFEVTSDDGANLYIDGGVALVNNDGTHGVSTKAGVKYLSRAVHSFQLDYFDAGGSHALMLKSGGVTVPSSIMFH